MTVTPGAKRSEGELSLSLTGPTRTAGESVARTRLLESIAQRSDLRSLTLSAAAGFGKSTLLEQLAEQWVTSGRGRVVQLTVPEFVDSRVIAETLAQQLRGASSVNEGPLPASYDDPSWHSATLPALRRLLGSQVDPLLVIVDDSMNLADPWAPSLFQALIDDLPDRSLLALGTRAEPPQPIRALRSTGRTLELGASELAMDSDEALLLLERVGVELSNESLDQVVEQTEGWPVGLYLLGTALRGDPEMLQTQGATGLTPGWVADYLADELFDQLDKDTADFLMQVSVLEDLCGPDCDAVCGREGSLELLRSLALRNQLVSRCDQAEECYRLHHLFSEFLRSKLYARSISDFHGAHRRAFEWYAQQGLIDRAVRHARQMGDDEQLAEYVWQHAWQLLTSGRMPALRQWLVGLEDRRIFAHTGLVLSDFYVSVQEGDMERTQLLAAKLQAGTEAWDLEGRRLAQCQVALAVHGAEGLDSIVELTTSALELLLPVRDAWAIVALYLRGVVRALHGDPAAAVHDLQTAVQLCGELGVYDMRALSMAAQAELHLMGGDLESATELIEQAREVVFTFRLENVAAMAPVFTASAAVLLARGQRDAASQDALRGLRLTSLIEAIAPWHAVAGRLSLAQVFWRLGDRQRARVLVDEARDRYIASVHAPVLDAVFLSTNELVSAAADSSAGPSLLTTAELRVLQYLPSHLSFPEIGQRLFLSRHTVKSQALSAYRKLGVSSRSEAVARAEELGLLPSLMPRSPLE